MDKRKIATVLLLVTALVLGVLFGVRQILPPPAPENLSEEYITVSQAGSEPNLSLMLQHIRQMASKVHSVDSEGIKTTHAYLLQQLGAMGFDARMDEYMLSMDEVLALQKERAEYRQVVFDETEESNRDYSGIGDKPTMNLTNIYAHVDAPGTQETIIFMAHTDSVKMGPGAFDDIVSVASLLEGMRQLKHMTPKRDLLFLFTDGEEQGLLGAAKFVKDHPEYRGITRLVINIEARGNKGSLLMFETTPANLGIVTEYSKAVSRPVSFSIATAVYRSMHNDTDLTRFIMDGYPGMNLSVIQGADVYHTARDSYETFSRSSARHYLDTVTELVAHFAQEEKLEIESGEDSVHFPLMSGNLVVFPQSVANAIAYAAFILTLAACGWLVASKKASLGAVLASSGLQLALTAVSGALSFLVVRLTLNSFRLSGFKDTDPIFYALIGISTIISFLLFRLLSRKARQPFSPALGVLLVPSVLAFATTFLFPAVTYLFSLTVLSGVIVILLSIIFRPGAALYNAMGIFLTLLLFVPIVLLVYVALGYKSAYLSVALAQIPLTMIWGLMSLVKREEK